MPTYFSACMPVENVNENQNSEPIVEVNEADFVAEVLKSKQPVLVAFWAPWSRPCQVLKPVLDEVAAARTGGLRVVLVNADDNPNLSMWYGIQSIPTLLYFVAARPRARVVGTVSKEAILAQLQTIFHSGDSTSPTVDPTEQNERGDL
jgi:thioredoxin 1